MSDKELRNALLSLDAADLAGVADLKQQTWQVLERDRRRVRLLTMLSICIWLFAAALILTGLISFGLVFPQQAKLVQDAEAGNMTAAQRDDVQRMVLMSFQKGTLLIAFSVAVMAVAALFTVLLILMSRRAMLRQMNAGLLEIAEQMKRIRPRPADPMPGQAATE